MQAPGRCSRDHTWTWNCCPAITPGGTTTGAAARGRLIWTVSPSLQPAGHVTFIVVDAGAATAIWVPGAATWAAATWVAGSATHGFATGCGAEAAQPIRTGKFAVNFVVLPKSRATPK